MATRDTSGVIRARRRLKAVYDIEAPAGEGVCTYCGNPAEHMDHVLPVSHAWRLYQVMSLVELRTAYEAVLKIVPCCRDCNALLGTYVPRSLDDERKRVAEKLAQRHRKLLAAELWFQDELNELGPGLRSYVEGNQFRHLNVDDRIRFARQGGF